MSLEPFYVHGLDLTERKMGDLKIREIAASSLDKLLAAGSDAQKRASALPLEDRLSVFGSLVAAWKERLEKGVLGKLLVDLSRTTGYSEGLVASEFKLVPEALDPENIRRNLQASLGNPHSIEGFVEISEGEYLRNVPAGPVFIISSGNSLIPPLIPAALSLVTGNFTLLRPSLSNYGGVLEVFRPLHGLESPAAKLISELLVIGYFAHDSPSLEHLLGKSSLGVINFWGGEPARTEVCRKVSENPSHPRLVINGPLTGIAMIDEPSSDAKSAEGLAKNIILYDQQLCSSPTSAIFIGSHSRALEFAKMTAERLEATGPDFPMPMPEGAAYVLQSARRLFQFKGSTVLFSQDPRNMWTVVVSKDRSALDEVVSALPEFALHARRRFIEIVSVADREDAMEVLHRMPSMRAFKGVDKIQTVGTALSDEAEADFAERLVSAGVYRIVPLGDMYMRSPSEPYDGIAIPASFTYAVYRRRGALNRGM